MYQCTPSLSLLSRPDHGLENNFQIIKSSCDGGGKKNGFKRFEGEIEINQKHQKPGL